VQSARQYARPRSPVELADGSWSDWSRHERKPGSVQNEGLTRVNDNVARIGGLRDPNNTVDAEHAETFAVTNIQYCVGFDFDLAIGVLVHDGYLRANEASSGYSGSSVAAVTADTKKAVIRTTQQVP
jgi:hypothetical protein